MTTTTERPVLNFPTQGIDDMEREIRHAAASVLNAVRNRRDHPSYGYTKTSIRAQYAFLRGLVATFAFLTGQTANAQGVSPLHVTWRSDETANRLLDVETAMRNL